MSAQQTKSWNDLPRIGEVESFNSNDSACLKEVGDILERYGVSKRFGVALLHQHFAMGEDEILLESCDASAKILTIRPTKLSDAEGEVMTTMYRFDEGVAYGCSFCLKNHH